MEILKIQEDFYWLGVKDTELRTFDIIMETKYGTTYNSYLLKTSVGVVLFETVKEKFFDEYLDKLKELVDISDIKYIVISHTEPDHSGSLKKLMDLNPNIEVISSMIASKYLSEIVNEKFNSRIVKDNEVISLGNKTLTFYTALNLHWPDAIYTYILEDKVLVSCDSFGCHFAVDDMFLSKITKKNEYQDSLFYYTQMIMGPFKNFIKKAIDKIKPLDIKIIATGHGPIIDTHVKEIIEYYEHFSEIKPSHDLKVSIAYVSAYGYTKEMAEVIYQEICNNGIECKMFDLVEEDEDHVFNELVNSDVILYGSSTILQDALPPVYSIMNRIIAGYHGTKKVSAFGSYGWSGEAVPNLLVRLKQQKMKVLDEGCKVLFRPSEIQKESIKEYAQNIINQL